MSFSSATAAAAAGVILDTNFVSVGLIIFQFRREFSYEFQGKNTAETRKYLPVLNENLSRDQNILETFVIPLQVLCSVLNSLIDTISKGKAVVLDSGRCDRSSSVLEHENNRLSRNVGSHQSTPHNIPEERRDRLCRCGISKRLLKDGSSRSNRQVADIFITDIIRTSNRSGLLFFCLAVTVGRLQNVVLRRTFGDAREDATGGLETGYYRNLVICRSCHMIRKMRMKWARNVA